MQCDQGVNNWQNRHIYSKKKVKEKNSKREQQKILRGGVLPVPWIFQYIMKHFGDSYRNLSSIFLFKSESCRFNLSFITELKFSCSATNNFEFCQN